jgi:hypothetical protein
MVKGQLGAIGNAHLPPIEPPAVTSLAPLAPQGEPESRESENNDLHWHETAAA